MEQAEKLAALLDKLRLNKEKVPLKILKTKYKAAYEKLTAEIKTEAQAVIKPIAARPPSWLKGQLIKQEYGEEISAIFNRIYQEGSYAKKIGQALYKRYSVDEARQLAEEINRKYQEELLKLFRRATCLYTTAENWDPENPLTPKIYNDLVDKFWDEEKGEWISEDKPPGAALLIFTTGKEPEKEETA